MRSKTAQRILGQTPQEAKDKVRALTNREIQLYQLGFKKYEKQFCFQMWKYHASWLVDFRDVYEPVDYDWECFIENLKYELKKAEKHLKQEELYVLGVNFAQKEIKQQILDLKNKYKSHLQEETNCKIGKNINFVRETELKAKISTLIELEKKLKL